MRMPFYALIIIQLIQSLPDMVKQVWYVDDVSAGGKLQDLCIWWNQLSWLGILYGYLPNDKKILLRAGLTWGMIYKLLCTLLTILLGK